MFMKKLFLFLPVTLFLANACAEKNSPNAQAKDFLTNPGYNSHSHVTLELRDTFLNKLGNVENFKKAHQDEQMSKKVQSLLSNELIRNPAVRGDVINREYKEKGKGNADTNISSAYLYLEGAEIGSVLGRVVKKDEATASTVSDYDFLRMYMCYHGTPEKKGENGEIIEKEVAGIRKKISTLPFKKRAEYFGKRFSEAINHHLTGNKNSVIVTQDTDLQEAFLIMVETVYALDTDANRAKIPGEGYQCNNN